MEEINKTQHDNMLHAIGRPVVRTDWKAKTNLYKAYRNRFCTYKPDVSWEDLVKKNFAGLHRQRDPGVKDGYLYFSHVTEAGMEQLIQWEKERGDAS